MNNEVDFEFKFTEEQIETIKQTVEQVIEVIKNIWEQIKEIIVNIYESLHELFDKDVLITRKKKKGKRYITKFMKIKFYKLLM